MGDIQEMSFQNVVDTILKPMGVTVGGYPDDLFVDVTDTEREQWQCNICYMVSREVKQCDNKHLFCATCVFAWSMTYGANCDKCPVCRSRQPNYDKNTPMDDIIGRKRVNCLEKGCGFKAPLHYYLKHSHGMKLYGSDVDLESLKRVRPEPVQPIPHHGMLFLPSLRVEAGDNVREGRNLLQDMMLVLHLEMELRRRAIDRFASEDNETERVRHMSEVLAIQEQMQEITGFLNLLFSIPPNSRAGPGARMQHRGFPGIGSSNSDEDGDSSESDSSDSSYVVSSYRQAGQQISPNSRTTGNRNTNDLTSSNLPTPHRAPIPPSAPRSPSGTRIRRRSDIREDLMASGGSSSSSSSENSQSTVRAAPVTSNRTLAPLQSTNTQASATRNQIDMNNNSELAAAGSIRRQCTLASPVAVAASSESILTGEMRSGIATPSARNSASRPRAVALRSSNMESLPTPSASFQSALETLPPISPTVTQPVITSMYGDQPDRSTPPLVPQPPASSLQEPARACHPTPPTAANSGRRIIRRHRANDSPAQNRLLPSRHGNRERGQNNSSLPSTSGELLRSRRRSEILKEIRDNL